MKEYRAEASTILFGIHIKVISLTFIGEFMKHNTLFIQTLMNKLSFPENSKKTFTKIFERLDNESALAKEFDTAYNFFTYPDFLWLKPALKSVSRAAEKYGENEMTLHFCFILSCMEGLYEKYKKNGLSEEIYWQTADDLRCKLLECIDLYGVDGTFVPDWFEGFFTLNRLALGRFQYQKSLFEVKGGYVTKSGYKIEENTPALSFHIPSSGVSLSDEIRLDSYKKAYEFYKDSFQGPMVLVCHSWLLHPEYKMLLPESSNLVKFMNDFEVTHFENTEKFDDDWRVFGKDKDLPIDQLPEKTSLQRACKQMLKNGCHGGWGYGVILFDGEKII